MAGAWLRMVCGGVAQGERGGGKVLHHGREQGEGRGRQTLQRVEQCAFRIVLRGDKYKTVVYAKEEHAPSSPTAAEDASADAPESAVCEGEKEGECTNVD